MGFELYVEEILNRKLAGDKCRFLSHGETFSTDQKSAVGDLMETIRICLCHVMGEDDD